jgi:ribosome-associated protein
LQINISDKDISILKKNYMKEKEEILMPKKPKSKQTKEVIAKVKSIEDELASEIIASIDGNKIENIVDKKCPDGYFAGRIIIGTGSSTRHIAGSAEKASIMLKNDYDLIPDLDITAKEWVVLVCGSIVVHLMTQEKRDHYNLEELIDNLSKKA